MATAYYLLRPFFSPKETSGPHFLSEDNWHLDLEQSTTLHGATPGCGQELNAALHPHLDLDNTMVHVPRVNPGDYVAWHCDTIHAVDKEHKGRDESSVLYIPACPLSEVNAHYLVRQREAFLTGVPSPDFPGGVGESAHVNRPGVKDVEAGGLEDGDGALRAMGLKPWVGQEASSIGEQRLVKSSNSILHGQ